MKNGYLLKIVQVGLILLVIMIALTYGAVRNTERPEFCITCHFMQPYYQAWKTSNHKDVPCVDCHYEPGVISTVKGKFKALNEIVRYVTRTQGTRAWAEVSDKSCLRAGCHTKRLVEGKVKFGEINFDHTPHLMNLRRGKKLRCTSCHSQIMIGSHMTVTTSTCFLCHFKGMPRGQAVGGCLACHALPKKVIVVEGVRFKHSEYIDKGAVCADCHLSVTSGAGNVPKKRCVNCHGEPERINRYAESDFLHRKHVSDHKVECTLCHDQIEHGATEIRSSLKPNCNSCHGNMHGAQRDLFAGTGGIGVAGRPSPMFLARVECESCHIVDENTRKNHYTGYSLKTREVSCMNCHGTEVDGLLDNWKKYLADRMATTEKLMAEANARSSKNISSPDAVRLNTLLKNAQNNYDILRYGHGEHNIEYARDLFDATENMLKSVIDPAKPFAPAPISKVESCTRLCHVSPPKKTITFKGRTFPHGKHLEASGLACGKCHSTTVHKMTTVKPADCDSCHHAAQRGDCLKCHAAQIPQVRSYQKKPFPHINHIQKGKVDCVKCHIATKDNRMAFRQDCVTCHDKKPPSSHTNAWKGAHGKQSMADGAACSSCHKATFCTNCHQTAMPHPKGWATRQHADAAAASRNICANCHNANFCADCHSKIKPASADKHQDCKSCHETKAWAFKGTGATCQTCHKNKLSSAAPDKHKNCIGCHKPHTWKPSSPPALCAQCHKDKAASEVPEMADCSICHAPHTWKFTGNQTCYDCHDDVRKDIGKSNLMPDCTNCHKTHKWKTGKLNLKSICGTCHQDMPDHDSSDFDVCTDCHKPHIWTN